MMKDIFTTEERKLFIHVELETKAETAEQLTEDEVKLIEAQAYRELMTMAKGTKRYSVLSVTIRKISALSNRKTILGKRKHVAQVVMHVYEMTLERPLEG